MQTKRQDATSLNIRAWPPSGKGSAVKKTNREKKNAHGAAMPLPTVSIIGVGRLGAALALALDSCGYAVEAVVTRRLSHARRVARMLNGTSTLALSAAQLDQLPQSDLTFITTPDDLIAATVAQLALHFKQRSRCRAVPYSMALHMSGALSSAALQPLGDLGYSIASLHPLVSVSDSVRGAESLRRAFYCIEGERKAVATARKIVRDLGAQSFSISAKDKMLYHAAAVTASGHFVALFDIATDMLAQCGLSKTRARAVLLPLVQSTVENLSKRKPSRALTGSFARADVEIIRQHLKVLCNASLSAPQQLQGALEIYILLGARSLRLARENGALSHSLNEIGRLLENAECGTKRGRKTKLKRS